MPKKTTVNDTTKPKPKPRVKKVNGYKFPEKLPAGEVLKDRAKKEWVIGTSIGQGGFGEIYCASSTAEASRQETYVIKIEPHENGPLFVEKNFYIKIARKDDVEKWKSDHGIKVMGIPTFYGSGGHDYNKEKYRFIVIERYGQDLWSIFLKNKKRFLPAVVYKCTVQIIDVLQFIHEKGYVHGDIKGANLLLGLRKGTENNVFLVDFGLSCKYNTREFKKDPKKAHNGTIEYTSRDSHIGVPTRRGDMEILGFNLLHWLSSNLPWEKDIKMPEIVHQKKRELMANVKKFMEEHYPQVPNVISKYMEYVSKLDPDASPDYKYCKDLFLKELKTVPSGTNSKLDFDAPPDKIKTPSTPKKRASKRKSLNVEVLPSEESEEDEPKEIATPKRTRKKAEPKQKPVPKTKNANTKEETKEPKASWRDAPSAQASNIAKAGEYVKKTNPAKTTRRKTTK